MGVCYAEKLLAEANCQSFPSRPRSHTHNGITPIRMSLEILWRPREDSLADNRFRRGATN